MRRKSIHRFLSALLSLIMVISLLVGTGVFTAFAEEADVDVYAAEERADATYETMRLKWRQFLLGGDGTDLDLSNPAVASYVETLNKNANDLYKKMVKRGERGTFLFEGIELTPIKGTTDAAKERSGNIAETFFRLRTLALAWSTKGCDIYKDADVWEELVDAIDYVVDEYYFPNGGYDRSTTYGNWYHWDISCTGALGNITILLFDQLGADRVKHYAEAVQWYAPKCEIGGPHSGQSGGMTGGNLLLKANGTAQAGILLGDEAMLNNVSTQVKKTVTVYNDPKELFSTGNSGDGFYRDGSYIQHQALPYIAGYGRDLYNNFSTLGIVLKNSPWEITFEKGEDPVIFDFVFSGIEPFLYDSHIMDMVTSRAVTRKGYSDRDKNVEMMEALIPMRGTFPTQAQNDRFESMVKYYLSLDPAYYLGYMSNIYSITNAADILNDDSIEARDGYALTKTFGMDRTVHITPDFGMGIAMQSTRTFAHEIINNEGKRTWNIANGMVFLYDEDVDQYNDSYWCTVDPTRLPGTTAEHVVYSNGKASLNANIYDWTGGSSIGSNGVAGMYMKAIGRNDNIPSYDVGPRGGADMKKSYFMFNDRILMVGSSITSDTGDNVETIVENRKIDLDTAVVTIDGKAAALDKAAVLENPSWMHIEGTAGSNIGYYFPEDISLNALKETRTANWNLQGTSEGVETDSYATFYVDHGKNPENAGYAYMLLPGLTAEETAAYAEDPDVEILRCDGNIHAARDNKQDITAINFWNAGSIAGVTVDKPASVTMERKGDVLTIGVSEPTQRNVPVTVTLGMLGDVVSKDDTITVDETSSVVKFTINTTGSLGGTHVIVLENVEEPDEEADKAAVAAAKAAVEALTFEPVAQEDYPTEEAVKAMLQEKINAVLTNGVAATVTKVAYVAPEAGTLLNNEGVNGSYKFTVALAKNFVEDSIGETTQVITATKYVVKDFLLTFGADNTEALERGQTGRVYVDNMEDYAIDSVKYAVDNENVVVGEDGTLSLKEGYTPKKGETVTVTAEVSYYDPADTVFVDSFEGEKQFNATGVYAHSDKGSIFGRHAATAVTSNTGYPAKDLDEVSDVTVTAWYYDANGGADQTKFAFSINGAGNALGVIYDGTIAAMVNDLTKTHYGARLSGYTYNNYSWGTTDAARSTGWHKFEWVIDSQKGLTEKIDGKVISTNTKVGSSGTNHDLVKVENYEKIKSLNNLTICLGWNNNGTNLGEISHRHFIDGVSVVKNGAATKTVTLTSVEIPVVGVRYTVTPKTFEVNSDYPSEQTLYINPYMEGESALVQVLIDGKEVSADLWTAGRGQKPENAQNYPTDYRVTVLAEAFKGLAVGEHTLTLVNESGSETDVSFTAVTHGARDYYLSQNGNDEADGKTPATAWKTFEKLQSVTFGPGDRIFLDAESTWSGVQFRPEGSGAPGAPIVLTKYNDGGDASKRPILNGDGTLANMEAHSYLAFDAWRRFYPSGTVELFNVEHWEVSGLEVTNYTQEMQKGATGRNGIAVIYDYFETQGITELSGNAEMERQFYRAGKLQHVVIEDCYVHDVVGYHPINGAQGRGGKMSGGINAYGPYDDLKIDNNIVMYCDVEGIRNDVLAWMGDTRTQFPAYMEGVSISNNYIAGVPGDGVVISSANQPMLENNYLTDAGYSYYATSNTNNIASGVSWNANTLATCKDVATKTGALAKEMGNRNNPRTMGSTNFAGLWFIGTKDAVAQYNEAVNNVWVCNDSEAFDADMFTWGTVFQYNYTYRNNGGFCLFMGGGLAMDEGTLVRYNVSVEDAQSVGLVGGEQQNGLFHYNKTPEAVHNNLFILGDKVNTIFGGSSNSTYFYNNIVIAPKGLSTTGAFNGFHLNGSSDGGVQNPKLSGEIHNNIFSAGILDTIVDGSTVDLKDNIVLDDLDGLFVDLDGFLKAQPVKALLGRSDFHGTPVVMESDKGAGVAMSVEDGRKVSVPTGGFDYRQFAGIMLAENSPAIGKGTMVMRDYAYKAQNDAVNPLTTDFFKNDISNQTTADIGPHQYSYQHEHTFVVDEAVAATCCSTGLTEGKHCSICGWIDVEQEVTPVDPENHEGPFEVRDAVEAKPGLEGYTGDTYCLGCGVKVEEGEVIEALPENPFIPNRPAPVKPVGPTAPEFPFTDVHENDWFYDSVKSAWENDLVDGVSATKYAPNETLTVASAIKLAAALHQMDNDGYVSLKNGAPVWYSTYVDYAVENGVIEESYLNYTAAQMNAPVTRAEFIHIFYGAMDNYDVINDVKDDHIPDVKMTDKYADEIYTFYRAGILTGCDSKGSCRPATVITRGEVAAILIRMYDVTARVSITL